ncbi:carboxypeptidase-like regulatory domain-containing protein [Tunturiibacter gelidoferens]|uniref:5-hydroxyisourate hydrolase-like protein (Transthyretin family) n=1 Tax=Tunturiibacter gelidiferens TaxID=3069689 RepID=A0ACC5NV50_9BACT|nr:carboxypeptidase-like regulatory domain-containing protein [Edaphobacter lichenicola]MBB5338455.1 5-hydroxyisourate hydrolase-like protein (transthyretin family) [Edaphobacter lichenicola]
MRFFSSSLRRVVVAAAVVAAFSSFAVADSITGTVTNKTTNKPAAGDDVVLIRLQQGMQEATRTKTDAKGRFTLDVPANEGQAIHLVRVTHDKANYFRPAPPGTQSVEVDVYNAAAKVKGVSSEADVMRLQTDESGKSLHVVENFFVKNESSPPLTQFSDRPFEFYLPEGAVVEGSAALSPGGMPVQASPVPLGEPNHYAFIFPIRPGETRFQITYKLPYSGSLKFSPRVMMPTDTIAVMMPKSMTFKPGPSAPYTPVTEETTAQTYVARGVAPSQALDFTVEGTGQMPRDTGAAATAGEGGAEAGAPAQPGAGGATSAAASDTRPGGGLGTPLDPEGTNDPWAKYKWWILGGLGLVLAVGAGVMLKNGPAAAASPVGAGPAAPGSLLAAMKEELFALETDRLQGRLTESEYVEQKAALEVVLRRALARGGPGGDRSLDTSNVAGPVV